jgi:large subunit ribosomal protein L19
MATSGRAEEDGTKQARLNLISEFGMQIRESEIGADVMNVLDMVEKRQLRTDIPAFKPGDTIKVHVKIKEGDKERIQIFEGICIAQKHGGARATFTVRKMSFGHGVERIFPLHSKVIDKVEVVREGRVRRAKLYYIRELRGKAARIKEVKAAQ